MTIGLVYLNRRGFCLMSPLRELFLSIFVVHRQHSPFDSI